MSIRYDLYETPDIQQTGEQQPLHPRVVINGTVDQNEFLDRVHKFTGISRSLDRKNKPQFIVRCHAVFPKRVKRFTR